MPTSLVDWFLANLWIVLGIAAFLLLLIGWKLVARLFGVIIIPDDSIGLVTKKFVLFGSHRDLPAGKIIALKGEAGLQADTLAPGLKFGYWPWQYEVEISRFLVVPNGQIAIVEACDGKADGRRSHPRPRGRRATTSRTRARSSRTAANAACRWP
jgi:uncharacterized membrane protein YqiK